MGRIIIFTGKGGVGKTSTAAAHARKAALEGKKTLLVSTDMAHNLEDLFETPIGKEPAAVCDNLDILEIDPDYEMETNYHDIMEAFLKLLQGKDNKKLLGSDFLMFPGLEELFSLLKIQDIYEKADYELIIVDCAPTGETLSLLKMPELLSWYIEKFFPIEKIALKVLRPVSKRFFEVELPNEKVMNDIEGVYIRLIHLQNLLKNREVSSIRLVTIPEKMVVEESKRNYMYLNLYDFNVDGLYINRILPKEAENDFFHEWVSIQDSYIEELQNIFTQIPIYKIKWYEIDLNGVKSLDRVIKDALDREDIFSVNTKREKEVYEKTEDGYRLELYLPWVEKEEIKLHKSGTDLILRIGNWKRSIPLPNTVRNMDVGAKKTGDMLHVFFKSGAS